MQKKNSIRFLTEAGLIAAMYAALTLALPMASFGLVQCRFSEALTILAAFTPAAVPGLTVGCLVSNLAGLSMGANPAGAWDLLLGPLATLCAALLTRAWRHIRWGRLPIVATLPPVILNAVVIGAELTLVSPQPTWPVLGINMASIGAAQLIACTGGGLVLFAALERSGAAQKLLLRETDAIRR